jgi:hypothetical protein
MVTPVRRALTKGLMQRQGVGMAFPWPEWGMAWVQMKREARGGGGP